uniref:Uncharacterized protein n=1 Tax=Nothobranchius furzeri TaxID=105023 RepID=A0A8C6KPY0_NOTFU
FLSRVTIGLPLFPPSTDLVKRHVRSTTDTSATGTLNAIPVSFLEDQRHVGMTLPTALAAPVEALALGPSTVFWVAVYAWTVYKKASSQILCLEASFNSCLIHGFAIARGHVSPGPK